jgi:GT2 family glycosyltransferase
MTHLKATPIMILNWNGWDDTFACLESIQSLREDHEVWLVDNGSDQDRTDEARAVYPSIRVFRWDENYGWAGGYNRALKIAVREGYEFAYLLNNDCTVTPGFLSGALDVAGSDERIAVVGSRVSYAEQGGALVFDGAYHAPQEKGAEKEDSVIFVPDVHGAAMLVRLRALEELGYFDERLFIYGEETEWCRRAAEHGRLVAVAGKSLVFHGGYGSDLDSNAAYYRTRNELLIMRKHERRTAQEFAYAYRALRAANEVRRRGDRQRSSAIVSGLLDGLAGRCGKRGDAPPAWIIRALSSFWIFPAGFFQRRRSAVRSMVGQ